MDKVLRRFARFWSPGLIVGDCFEQDIDNLDPLKVKWPANAYAFTLHERTDVVDGNEHYTGDAKQVGPMYYHPDSKVETLAQVKLNPNSTETLISNMECNKWDRIIWARWGNWPQPFDDKKMFVL